MLPVSKVLVVEVCVQAAYTPKLSPTWLEPAHTLYLGCCRTRSKSLRKSVFLRASIRKLTDVVYAAAPR